MSYRNHYSGSPWQQGGPPFGMSSYGQGYSDYNDYNMMNAGYGRNYGGGMYGSGGGGGGGGMSQMRSMGYGGLSPSRYGNDRMGGNRQVMSRGQIQRKRLPQRSPAGGPRSKRPNLGSSERRMSRPRRRRDSRGGSKGRHDHSDDDTYNPEEPTDDASDIDCDGYESWKDSGDEAEEVVKKENGEQNDTDGDKKEDTKSELKKLICYVCKITCSSEAKHRRHQASKAHTGKIDELLAIRRQKDGGDKDDETSDNDGKGEKRRSSRKPSNWCTVCECVFDGNFLAHRRTKEHRKKRDKKYPKCRPCRMGFSSAEEYRDHYKSEDHKNRSAEFHYMKGLLSGSDDDMVALEPVKVEPEEEKEKVKEEEMKELVAVAEEVKVKEEKKEETEEGKEKEKEKEEDSTTENKEVKKEETKSSEEKKSRPREPKATGQSFVVSVQGYFCKVCRKFFKDGTVAKYKHCRSILHTETFKKGMAAALLEEEERQKLAEEQDKIDQKAADEAELAAEIRAIERAAKDTARREAAKKRASERGDDIEIKDSVEGDAVSDEGKEDKEDGSDSKAETNGHKPDSQESGAEKEDEKGSSDDKPAEVLEESAEGDEEGDEEQEKEVTKEEVTSSPATRRGRGRGRGRKRR